MYWDLLDGPAYGYRGRQTFLPPYWIPQLVLAINRKRGMFIGQRVNTFMWGHYYNFPKKSREIWGFSSLLIGEVDVLGKNRAFYRQGLVCLEEQTGGCDGMWRSLSGCGIHVRVLCWDPPSGRCPTRALLTIGSLFWGTGGRYVQRQSLSCTC